MGRESRAASTLMALLAVVVLLYELFPHKALIGPRDTGLSGLSASMLTAPPFQKTAWHGCGQPAPGEGWREECSAAVISRRSTVLAGYQASPPLAEAARVAPGGVPFSGKDPSRTRRGGRSPLSLLQILRC
ncbi:MAG: hypothetical protein ACRDZO_27760 [Egibacteraceae bacterium]